MRTMPGELSMYNSCNNIASLKIEIQGVWGYKSNVWASRNKHGQLRFMVEWHEASVLYCERADMMPHVCHEICWFGILVCFF